VTRIITDYLDEIVNKFPNKIAFADEARSMTFFQLQKEAFHIAQQLINKGIRKSPVMIYLDRNVECIVCFLGIAYSGNYYTMADTDMTLKRIEKILDILQPRIIISDMKCKEKLKELQGNMAI